MNLCYPNGELISIGDQVWFDEGMAVGYVASILTDVSNEATVLVNLFGRTSPISIMVGLPLSCFDDEGIGRLTTSEVLEVGKALDVVCRARAVLREMCAVFQTHLGDGVFAFVIAAYSVDRDVRFCVRVDGDDGTVADMDRSVLPPIAFAIGGGGCA